MGPISQGATSEEMKSYIYVTQHGVGHICSDMLVHSSCYYEKNQSPHIMAVLGTLSSVRGGPCKPVYMHHHGLAPC